MLRRKVAVEDEDADTLFSYAFPKGLTVMITDYDDLFTFENLYKAHLKARLCKRNKKDVIQFELNLSSNLWDLYDRLHDRTYRVSGYNKFTIYEPKKREIQALAYKDRIVQHCLCDNYLYPLLTARFIYDNGACQKGKGTDFAMNRLSDFFRDYYKQNKTNEGYILKADIHHYFPSINHECLKWKMRRVIQDKDILEMIERIIDSYENDKGKGLPMGNQTSQLFALYYLDQLDRQIKERLHIKYYVRYMDDMVLIHKDKEYLQSCLKRMTETVEDELSLEFNEKTQIFPIKNGIDFLGFHFYMTETGKVIRKVRTSTKKKYKTRMKLMKRQYEDCEIELEDIKKVLPGFNGHLKRGHTYKLRKSVLKEFVLIRHDEEEMLNEEDF